MNLYKNKIVKVKQEQVYSNAKVKTHPHKTNNFNSVETNKITTTQTQEGRLENGKALSLNNSLPLFYRWENWGA